MLFPDILCPIPEHYKYLTFLRFDCWHYGNVRSHTSANPTFIYKKRLLVFLKHFEVFKFFFFMVQNWCTLFIFECMRIWENLSPFRYYPIIKEWKKKTTSIVINMYVPIPLFKIITSTISIQSISTATLQKHITISKPQILLCPPFCSAMLSDDVTAQADNLQTFE